MDEDSTRLLQLLVPHIQQALEIHNALGIAQQHMAGAEAIADASSTAAFLLSREGGIVHCNAAALTLISDGRCLATHNGRLTSSDGRFREKVRSLLMKSANLATAASVSAPATGAPAALALSLPRQHERQPLHLLASPLPPNHRDRSGAELLLLVTDPETAPSFPDDILRALFQLTPAETEVANGLLMGYSLAEIAGLRRVTPDTTRLQIKSLLSKTGTHRQSDLVRLLMTLPQPHSNA
jgi:DNA-binding CsgD family transcriptional regulator